MNNRVNILFYSLKCNDCRNLITLLQNENLFTYFKLYCVDDNLNKIPPQIKYVPTIIVSGVNKPLVGNETFKWVQQLKFLKQQALTNINNQLAQKKLLSVINTSDGPMGWMDNEMGNLSDQFAYTKIDKPLPQSYVRLNSGNKNTIFTPPNIKKITVNDQKKLISNMKRQRSVQDQQYKTQNKQQHLQAIANSEQIKTMSRNSNSYNNNKRY